MRHLLFALLLAVAPLAARAQDAPQQIQDVIASQLDAFNDRDVGIAWSYASPMIQGLFGNPSNFAMMVENGYPMVWSNSEPRFLELEPFGNGFLQKVLVKDAEGVIHVLAYKMIETADGWRIDGVSLIPAPDVGV
ncbi:hypothetical protein OG2516_14371 [Oceanicola granulosus HTCC2516]|uniref:DUF4864 domain-containing protein n=1 Tax=Oceanicola granulosus (strain ATCC BAA-861 / DSM 15982 / KCTC 12143 / HTCC2516) TaxID=314256 RepID=Q2CB03_OCEGH|nr:DUF4864 domain-containing protein [Oceanicola granulosus]EAR49873.1 hypothetical protein OG2516_14371 [Oceanicola granulosus HTCC2516]